MRLAIGVLILILVFVILAYSDFFLKRKIIQKIKETNDESRESYDYIPIKLVILIVFSAICWIPVSYMLFSLTILLEYKIIILVTYLLITSSLLYLHISKKSSKEIARKSLPILVFISIAFGLIFIPFWAVLKSYLGNF